MKCRNERSPFRALTQLVDDACESPITLSRNERSPFRALTHLLTQLHHELVNQGRNERSPFRALTPSSGLDIRRIQYAVEMKEARLGR